MNNDHAAILANQNNRKNAFVRFKCCVGYNSDLFFSCPVGPLSVQFAYSIYLVQCNSMRKAVVSEACSAVNDVVPVLHSKEKGSGRLA